jgi:iron complex outermembrane receptor protein
MALHWKQDVHREVDEVGAPEERYEDRSYALAIEHEWRPIDGLTLTPGYAYTVQEGREAENNVDGELEPFPTGRADAHNVQLTALWGLSPTSSLLAGVSRKTRFPTIKDRYSFRLGSAVPNPALDPETAIHYEVGIEQRHGRLEWRAAVFQADLDDAIENVVVDSSQCSAPNPNCFQQRNVGEQRNRGIELSLGWQPMSSLRLDAQASYLDRDNLSSPDVHPTDTPEQKYRLSAQWQPIAGLMLRPEVQHESRRYSTSDGSRTTDAFTVVNLFSRYEPMPSVGLELGIRNLGDALYAYQEGFYEAGRSWLAEVDYRF